jgi:hypothetical protein
MEEELQQSKKSELALAIARGVSIAAWARKNEVSRRSAFYWAKEPKVREEVEEWRRNSLNRAIGRMAIRSTKAADGIATLAENAESESVRLRAWRAILADQMAVAKFSTLEYRLVVIEERAQARAGNVDHQGYGPAN